MPTDRAIYPLPLSSTVFEVCPHTVFSIFTVGNALPSTSWPPKMAALNVGIEVPAQSGGTRGAPNDKYY